MNTPWRTAASATVHCLTGRAIGAILGTALATWLGRGTTASIVLSVVLAFTFGYELTMSSVLRAGVPARRAVRLALASDTLSNSVMDVVDNLVILVVPGAMVAGLTDSLFWGSLVFSLAVAFVATVPVNRALIARGGGTLSYTRTIERDTGRLDRGVRIGRMSYVLGQGTGPLRGLRVIEIAGIGPGPHAAMTLADLGADVIRVEPPGGTLSPGPRETDVLTRSRPSVALDLKHPDAVRTVLSLVESADVLLEGLRPGATERLGLGPDDCHACNPRLVYGRITGWGQDGPLARTAGHDLNYIALSGTLFGLGQTPERPQFPTNLVGDFGGGSTYLVIGVLAALLESRVSGVGQVVDAAIVDGAAHLGAMHAGMLACGTAREQRAAGLLDGGVPWYDVYETSDGRHMSVGPLEPQFYAAFVERLGVAEQAPDRNDPGRWTELRALFTSRFRERTQAQWAAVFDGSDACCAPVLPLSEAADHPHLAARETYVGLDGMRQPAPAPRFSRTRATLTTGASVAGGQTREALTAWGIDDVEDLLGSGAAVQA